MSAKICASCHKEKTIIEFSNNKNTKDGLQYNCKSCVKEYKQQNKERANQLKREDRQENSEKYRQQAIRSHKLHRDDRLEKQHIYYENNKEYFAEKNKKYRNENIDEILLRNRQRSNMLDSFPIIKQLEIDILLDACNHQCFYCQVEVKRGINLHLDHKTPLARGGAHSIDNLAPACKSCNLRKGTKTIEEFLSRNK